MLRTTTNLLLGALVLGSPSVDDARTRTLETPKVATPQLSSDLSPRPMRKSTSVRSVGNQAPGLRFDLRLPEATLTERSAAPREVSNVLSEMKRVGADLTLDRMLEIFPVLKQNGYWVSEHAWTIRRDQGHGSFWSGNRERTSVFLGASFYPIDTHPLSEIRRRERDLVRQKRVFGVDVLYAVANSYVSGNHDGSPYTLIETYAEDSYLWYDWFMHFQILEHWVGGRLTVDYVDVGTDTWWCAGRDVWLKVYDEGMLVGHLCFTQFGFDIKGVPDDEGDVRDAMTDAHRYMLQG